MVEEEVEDALCRRRRPLAALDSTGGLETTTGSGAFFVFGTGRLEVLFGVSFVDGDELEDLPRLDCFA